MFVSQVYLHPRARIDTFYVICLVIVLMRHCKEPALSGLTFQFFYALFSLVEQQVRAINKSSGVAVGFNGSSFWVFIP